MGMYCYQCQEVSNGKGCAIQGVCGKTDETANLQDLLVYVLKGVSFWGERARAKGFNDENINLFVAEALFATVTNVSFDSKRIVLLINKAGKIRDRLKKAAEFGEKVPDAANFKISGDMKKLAEDGLKVGVLSNSDEDSMSLIELLVYGLKGIAVYTDHAYILQTKNDEILKFIQKALAATIDPNINAEKLVALIMEAGKFGVDAMALLDQANTLKYGNPEITQVYTGLKQGPAILVSGHDLLDLQEILEQTADKGINIYTHGEMLPANAYPELKKHKHLIGNYGSSWFHQQKEFDDFNGAIVMTTNCLQKPKDTYKERIYTTGLVSWPGIAHIKDRENGKQKDFSAAINKALILGGVEEKPGKIIPIGFAHEAVLSVADKIVAVIKSGAIKRFFVMAGCDGRHKKRDYFTKVAQALPKDTIILTAGCAKYRYNMLDLGDIGGIPRVLDAGQCNDSYSLVVIALKLKEAFGLNDLNELPISFDIAWYEQKAVIVLLALLYLGVKGIRLGPTLPAFISPNVLSVLVEKFNIKPISNVNEDITAMMAGN